MITVIIVSWNTRELTRAAVASALRQEVDEPIEVIVVDNGSTDGTGAALREDYPAVRLLEVGRNLGFARANNLALARARGDWTMLLNSDAELGDGCLARLLAVARAHPRAGALQPLIVGGDGRVQCYWDYSPSLARELAWVLWGRRATLSERWQRAARVGVTRATRAVGLSALFVPRWVWRRIGPLCEATFLYFEDSDLSERLHRAGLPMLLVPSAEVLHWGQQSSGQVPHRRRVAHYLSRLWFYRTHRDRASAALVRQLSVARACVGLAVSRGAARDELWRPILRGARHG